MTGVQTCALPIYNPKCATVVVMDMSGSMRYDGQYMNVKRMALALEGLIRSEYPGDFLRFFEMYSFARACAPGQIVELMPKPVTLFDPVVRLKVDMSREDVSESRIPPHFTNLQHALQLARQSLATVDTPNRQIIVITDGLPTQGASPPALRRTIDASGRVKLFDEAVRGINRSLPIDVVLLPMKGDVQAAHRFWGLARLTKIGRAHV